ncbi:MAG: hypothetical protein DCC55_39370 [Chloroflexi bacterium]|nr:MAG: hypothetical protein DCC55_39370 [Chloroflexota bacterium]
MLLSNFTHSRQRHRSDCLIACAEMVLNYLGIDIGYSRLRELLRAGELFTPFSHLSRLEILGMTIVSGDLGQSTIFESNIANGLPVIAGVRTLNWQHWGKLTTEHAVVVVGIDRERDVIYIHDPYFTAAPIEMSLIEFMIGWEEKDRQYAVIRLTPPED